MELLDFARGPALQFAIAVFVLGTLWRLVGVLKLAAVAIPSTEPETEFEPANVVTLPSEVILRILLFKESAI